MKKILFIILCTVFFISVDKVYALSIGDKLSDGQVIESYNSSSNSSVEITIDNTRYYIENFITNKGRTYVNLKELCTSDKVCAIISQNDDTIELKRSYTQYKDVEYKTTYTFKNNKYESILSVPNTLDFYFGEVETSPDVSPIKIDNVIYVPLRFITEALGSNVKWTAKTNNSNAKINITFYNNYNFNFSLDFYDVKDSKSYKYSDTKKGKCYDTVLNYNGQKIHNSKFFALANDFVEINYNNNVQTNICFKQNPASEDLYFVANYKGVPIIYDVSKEITESELPILKINGDTSEISKENEVKLQSNYTSNILTFNSFAKLKWQGNSSLAYDKKNYTIKLFEDANYNEKYKLSINNWSKRNKYCLKANYIDYTQSRNVVSAKLWGEVVNSRENLNENLKGLTNGGAIDGYPVVLYINDENQGLYTLNTCKDEKLFTGKNEPLVVYAANHFTEDIWFSNEESHSNDGKSLMQWDLEFIGDNVNENQMNNSLQEMVTFVFKSTDEEFKNSLSKYLDVEAAIDYMLFMYYINGSDNASINTLWVTYDGKVWIPSAYDMDATFGLSAFGREYLSYDHMLPLNNSTYISSNSDMILWDRLLNVYKDEVKGRYKKLRKDVLTVDNVSNKFNQFIKSIPTTEYLNDYNIWDKTTTINGEKMVTWENDNNSISLIDNELNKIIDYIKKREVLFDKRIESL